MMIMFWPFPLRVLLLLPQWLKGPVAATDGSHTITTRTSLKKAGALNWIRRLDADEQAMVRRRCHPPPTTQGTSDGSPSTLDRIVDGRLAPPGMFPYAAM